MTEAGEYFVALIFTALAVLFTFAALYGWSGIPQQPKVTKSIKAVLMIASFLWGVYWAVVILRLKGDKPWGNITRADLFKIGSYLTPDLTPIRPLLSASILGAFIAGAVVTYFVVTWRAKNQLCPDTRLHSLAEGDKASIQNLVRIVGILYQPDFGKAYIDFTFSVYNNSLYDIVIDNKIKKGGIRFGEDNEKFYYEPKIEGDKPKYCGSRGSTFFLLRQAIRAEDIPRFRDADDVLLYFHDLEIMFQGAAESTGIGSTRLRTDYYLQTKKGMWRDWDRLHYVFGYTDEQWADITSGRVKNPADSKDSQPAQAVPQPKPNIVFLRTQQVSVYTNDNGTMVVNKNVPRTATWRMNHPVYDATVATYHNQPSESRKVGSAGWVSAQLTYEFPGKTETFIVPRALWFPQDVSVVKFDFNDSHGFVIAAIDPSGSLCAVQKGHGLTTKRDRLPANEAVVTVRLISESGGEVVKESKFNLKSPDSRFSGAVVTEVS
ncbi:MAG TPA: hypothetical protein VIP46_22560 [Pyrinomonadaceae bacterium]